MVRLTGERGRIVGEIRAEKAIRIATEPLAAVETAAVSESCCEETTA